MKRPSLRERARHSAKVLGVGAAIAVLNVLVLMVLVSGLGVFSALANLVRFVISAQVHFFLDQKVVSGVGLRAVTWAQWRQFQLLKIGSTVAKQVGFLALTAGAGMHYLLAYAVCAGAAGLIGLLVRGKTASEPHPELAPDIS